MQLFDSHIHLESPRFEADRDLVIARARSAGVTRMMTCGSDWATSQSEVALAQIHEGLYAAVGIHPHEASCAVRGESAGPAASDLDEAVFQQLARLAGQPKAMAIGEAGLDYHYDFSPRGCQRAVLERQLALACELGLPIILHNRESDADLRRLVDEAPSSLRGVLHCFLSDGAMADWAVARGLYVGIAGPITFVNERRLPQIARRIPLGRLLIETDSPFLAPHPKRGRRNEPAYLVHVAGKLAGVLGVPVDELARRTTENACRLFGVA